MSRWVSFTLRYVKRAGVPFFFEGWVVMGVLFVAALGFTFTLTGASATAESLFQSPQSPIEAAPAANPTPAAPPPANPTAAAPPPANPTPAAPQQPTDPVAPAQDQAAPAGAAPSEAAPPTGSEGEPQPAPIDAEQSASEGEAPLPPPLPEPERRSGRDPSPASGDDAQMVVDQAEFIDTVVVSFAYVWLCCGIVLILVIPLIFLFLHIRGRSKMLKEEQY